MDGNSRYAEYPARDALPQLLAFVVLVLALVVAWPALLVGFALRIVMGRSRRLGWALWVLSLAIAFLWGRRTRVLQAISPQVTALHYLLYRQWSISALLPHLKPLWLDSAVLAPLIALALMALSRLRGKQQEDDIVLASGQALAAQFLAHLPVGVEMLPNQRGAQLVVVEFVWVVRFLSAKAANSGAVSVMEVGGVCRVPVCKFL